MVDKLVFQKHLEEGESILFATHKHWVESIPDFLNVIFFGFMLPWVFYFAGFTAQFYVVIIFVWMFLAFLKLLYSWVDWYADVWLFTNMSIIVVEWQGLFSNTSKRIGYEDAEGVSFAIKGFWGTILRFGDVTLQVISGTHVTMKNAKDPKKIELALMKHQGNFLSQRDQAHSNGLKAMLSEMVAHHLRKK